MNLEHFVKFDDYRSEQKMRSVLFDRTTNWKVSRYSGVETEGVAKVGFTLNNNYRRHNYHCVSRIITDIEYHFDLFLSQNYNNKIVVVNIHNKNAL